MEIPPHRLIALWEVSETRNVAGSHRTQKNSRNRFHPALLIIVYYMTVKTRQYFHLLHSL
jgi:hypothetical protein